MMQSRFPPQCPRRVSGTYGAERWGLFRSSRSAGLVPSDVAAVCSGEGSRHRPGRCWLVIAGALFLSGLPFIEIDAQAMPTPAIDRRAPRSIAVDQSTRQSIDRGLEFLYRSQNPDGSWTDFVGRKVHYFYDCTQSRHVGSTALAGLAFLSSGALPTEGPRQAYCRSIRRALDFVIDSTSPEGFISVSNSRMYSHAFATLFLAEAYGASLYPEAERLEDALRRAVGLIVQSQNEQGGWRYLPRAVDADMSVTVCQVMALRAARNAGIFVPRSTIDAAIRYVKNSYLRGKGFSYQLLPFHRGSRQSFALNACGVATLYGAGEYESYEIREGLELLWRDWDSIHRAHSEPRDRYDFYYGHYYGIQAAFQAGGTYWERWYHRIRDELLSLQRADGSWEDLVGQNYATAVAVIILQMPNQYLPITES